MFSLKNSEKTQIAHLEMAWKRIKYIMPVQDNTISLA